MTINVIPRSGSLEKFQEPQVWIAINFDVRELIPMQEREWERARMMTKIGVLDTDVQAVLCADPIEAIRRLQEDVKAFIFTTGLAPANFTFNVARVPVIECRFWRQDLSCLRRFFYLKHNIGATDELVTVESTDVE